MSDIKIFEHSSVELIRHCATDSSVLDAMLVSTLSDRDRGEDDGRDTGRINFLMKNRHGSPFEHNMMTFRVHAPIAVFREWLRHRIGWSYNEQSGRYTEFNPEFYIPPLERPLTQVGKPGAYEFVAAPHVVWEQMVAAQTASFQHSWDQYQLQLSLGVAKEVARGVLPVYIMSTIYATCNARSLMAFLSLRRRENLVGEATFPSFPMYEIDDCAEQLECVFAELMPLTWRAYVENGRVAP